ncbi:HSF-type DNA-binding-domain-containing protein [Schizophyllum commune]
MVNDPKNEALIRWSDSGDSFFVLDHERFAREVLGRWFKHQNFSSFVRQLNMYGFHKVQHLQQGTLRSSETDGNEFWNFAHPNFLRGRSDLLALIQRKKQAQNSDGEGAGQEVGTSGANGQQVQLDISGIVAGLAAIKRHQDMISSELTHLRENNNLLWQEAMEARARAKKQQDTINRIVKFLAGIFGNHNARSKHEEEEAEGGAGGSRDGGPGAIVPHSVMSHMNATVPQMQRLMIEDTRPYNSVDIEEVEDDEQHSSSKGKQREYTTGQPPPTHLNTFAEPEDSTGYRVETPPASSASVAPVSPAATEGSPFFQYSSGPSPAPSSSTSSANTAAVAANSPSPVLSSRHATPPAASSPSVEKQQQHRQQLVSSARTPPYHPSASPGPPNAAINPDDFQTLFNNLSPAQINSFMTNLPNVFGAGSTSPGPSFAGSAADFNRTGADGMPSYPTGHGSFGSDATMNGMGGVEGLLSFDPSTPGGYGDGMDYDTYHAGYGYGASGGPDQATGQSQHAVAQGGPPLPNWQAAEDIERDVSALNAKINTLIENTSPSVTHAQPVAQAIASPWSANAQLPTRPPLSTSSDKPASMGRASHPILPPSAMATEPLPAPLDALTPNLTAPADFDFTEFLSKYVSGVEGAQDNNALMDEVMSNAGDSTGQPAHMEDQSTSTPRGNGRKRKSDAMPPMPDLTEPPKKGGKRRRGGA